MAAGFSQLFSDFNVTTLETCPKCTVWLFAQTYRIIFLQATRKPQGMILRTPQRKQWNDSLGNRNDKPVSLPTTIRVNSNPLLTDFLYTWLGRLAKPTYPSRFFCCCLQNKQKKVVKTIKEMQIQTLKPQWTQLKMIIADCKCFVFFLIINIGFWILSISSKTYSHSTPNLYIYLGAWDKVSTSSFCCSLQTQEHTDNSQYFALLFVHRKTAQHALNLLCFCHCYYDSNKL